MKYLFAFIGLLFLTMIASAQETKTAGQPPVRTTDKGAVPPRVAAVLPVRSSGNARTANVAVSLPIRKADGGGGTAAPGAGALNRGATGAAGAGPGKGAVTAPTTGTGAVTSPSMLSAKQAADLRTKNAGGVVAPAVQPVTPVAH
jgi:hypothetical protein